MIVTLLVVSFVFLVTNAPYHIGLIMYHYFYDAQLEEYAAMDTIVKVSTLLLLYINCGINFILYCISDPKFRRELKICLCGQRTEESTT